IASLMPPDERDQHQLSWLRWLPHTRAVTDLFAGSRFVAGRAACRRALRDSAVLADGAVDDNVHLLLVVHEASGVDVADLLAFKSVRPAHVHLLWLGSSSSRIPASFEKWIEARSTPQPAEVELLVQPAGEIVKAAAPVELHSAATTASRLSPLTDESDVDVSQSIPSTVPLGGVISPPAKLVSASASPGTSLIAALGEDASGPFLVDLEADGPHLLVAGTTGSGKSELLRSLVLSLACRYRPVDLALLLIDFKGGASLGDLASLPQAIGTVTNLTPLDVDRVLRFLSAEVERRQTRLAPYNGEFRRYYKEHPHQLPRLVVVIDEFAGFLGGEGAVQRETAVLNIAARGRSLGVHLVIATQSPKGVVTPQLRANVNARIALRVVDIAESMTVIDSEDAYRIPRSLAGRAFLRSGSEPLREFQVAHTESRVLATHQAARVSLTAFDLTSEVVTGVEIDDDGPATDAEEIVNALAALARDDGTWKRPVHEVQPRLASSLTARPTRPKAASPPASSADVDLEFSRAKGSVFVGLRDEPERQKQPIAVFELARGGLLLTGGAASGRSHALAAVAADFANHAGRCHIVVIDAGGGDLLRLVPRTTLSVTGSDEGAITHVVQQLSEEYGARTAPTLVLIDRLDALQEVLPAPVIARIARLIANGGRSAVYVAASTDLRLPLEAEVRASFRHRLTFLEEHAGVAVEQADRQSVVQFADPVNVHFPSGQLLTSDEPAFPLERQYAREGGWRPLGFPGRADRRRLRFEGTAAGVAIGVDDLRHESVFARVGEGFAIAGGAGSGRTTLLMTLGEELARRHGGPVPLLTSGVMPDQPGPWWLDLKSHWKDRWSLARNNADLSFKELTGVIFSEGALPLLAVDDADRIATHLDFLPLDLRGALLNELRRIVAEDKVKPIAVLTHDMLLGFASLPFGEDRLGLRNNVVALQPLSRGLIQSRLSLPPQVLDLLANVVSRDYAPGQGAFISRGKRRELTVVPTEMATTIVRNYVSETVMGV
ncbi:MAG: segregation ATPase FtsK/SpoIIIE, family, partial [Thermoleophilaceae bacterium]|nr:segregation ATPase FtsK/SpoIIIE, family [Thermoleophilaceae bacterium]